MAPEVICEELATTSGTNNTYINNEHDIYCKNVNRLIVSHIFYWHKTSETTPKSNMEKFILSMLSALLIIIISVSASAQSQETVTYKPKSQELYNTILHMDSVYFNAYNNCDMSTQAAVFADSIEFYHDEGGLMTSKKDLLAAIKENICGKVTRVLVQGSVEVYPIPGFGAVEIGYHRFINHQESETPSKPGRFVAFWRQRNGKWQLYRVASMHAGY